MAGKVWDKTSQVLMKYTVHGYQIDARFGLRPLETSGLLPEVPARKFLDSRVLLTAGSTPQESQEVPSSVTFVTQVKRGVGCTEINATTYMSGSSAFDISCDTAWPYASNLYILYTIDFASCMNGCLAWNTNMTGKCVGVSWIYGNFGPLGVGGGSECIFNWKMLGDNYSSNGDDSAQLRIAGPALTVFPP